MQITTMPYLLKIGIAGILKIIKCVVYRLFITCTQTCLWIQFYQMHSLLKLKVLQVVSMFWNGFARFVAGVSYGMRWPFSPAPPP